MNDVHPLTGCLLDPHTLEQRTMSEAIDAGFDTVRACLLNEAPMPDSWMIVPTLLYLATGEDRYAVHASRPLYEELAEEGVDLTGWVEPLETLKLEMEAVARDFLAGPVDAPLPADSPVRPDQSGENSEAIAQVQARGQDEADALGVVITNHGNGRRTATGTREAVRTWFENQNRRLREAHEPGASKRTAYETRRRTPSVSVPVSTVDAVARSSTGAPSRGGNSSSSRRSTSSRGSPRPSSSGDDDLPERPRLEPLRRTLVRLLGGHW